MYLHSTHVSYLCLPVLTTLFTLPEPHPSRSALPRCLWPGLHIDEAVPETVGVVGTMETAPLEVHLPMDMPFDHMKNIYVAIATLAAALLIFIVVVSRRQFKIVHVLRLWSSFQYFIYINSTLFYSVYLSVCCGHDLWCSE